MKKTLLLTLILFSALSYSKADQLSYLSKEQAQRATAFLQKQAEIIIWCACCDNEPKLLVKVSKVYFERTEDKRFYHIFLVGIDSAGKKIKQEIDLAYIHINKNGKGYCVGKELGLKCDP